MDNLAHVRDSRQPGHFWADNEIVEQHLPEIGVYGFAVYMLLCKYADSKTGQCDPSVSGMAAKLGVSAPTVRGALDKLKDAKLITIRHRSKEYDGKRLNQTSVYTILAVKKGQRTEGTKPGLVPNDIDQGTKGDLPGVLNQVDQGTKPGLGGVLNQVSTNNTHENKTHLTTPTPTTATSKRDQAGGDGDGSEKNITPAYSPDPMYHMLQSFKIGAAKQLVNVFRELRPGLDVETVRQSIENQIADRVNIGVIVKWLRENPPEPGKPYPRAASRASPPLVTTRPIIPPDVLTPGQLAERSRARRAERES